MFEHCGRRWTDAGPWVYYKLTYEPLGAKKVISIAYVIPTHFQNTNAIKIAVLVHKAANLSIITVCTIKLIHANTKVQCAYIILHTNVQGACIVKAKYEIAPSKAVVGVGRPMYALSLQA